MDARELLRLTAARRAATSGEGRRRREAAGLSLREVAGALGVDPTTLQKWERGDRAPRGEPAIRWMDLLDQLAAASPRIPA